MLTMLQKTSDKSKKLKSDAEHMFEDSKIKIDVIKMSILREEQSGEGRNNEIKNDRPVHEKSLEHRVDDIRHHIDIETRVAEGSRNILKQFIVAGDKKGQQEVSEILLTFFFVYFYLFTRKLMFYHSYLRKCMSLV